MTETSAAAHESEQLLHLVFGGELKNIDTFEFRDPKKIDVVGVFPNYDSAEKAWRAKAQQTVDSAQTRYFIVHLHRMLEPAGLVGSSPETLTMGERWGRGAVAQEALGFLLAQYLRLVRRTNRFVREPADLDSCLARPDAGDRRDVAWTASDDLLRLAEIDRAYGRADLAPSRRRRAGGRAAPSRRHARARLRRATGSHSRQGRGAGALTLQRGCSTAAPRSP